MLSVLTCKGHLLWCGSNFHVFLYDFSDLVITSHVSGQGDRIGPICVSICVWVYEAYLVHHLNGTGLGCAPLACIVHQGSQCSSFSTDVLGGAQDDIG